MKKMLVVFCLLFAATVALNANANEIVVSAGQTVANSLENTHATAWAIEYRSKMLESLSPHLKWSVMWLNEGHPDGFSKRDGLAGELWWSVHLGTRAGFSIGTGPYLFCATEKRGASGEFNDYHGVAWLGSVDVHYDVSEHFVVHARFNRVVTNDDTDTDVFLAGIGYKF